MKFYDDAANSFIKRNLLYKKTRRPGMYEIWNDKWRMIITTTVSDKKEEVPGITLIENSKTVYEDTGHLL